MENIFCVEKMCFVNVDKTNFLFIYVLMRVFCFERPVSTDMEYFSCFCRQNCQNYIWMTIFLQICFVSIQHCITSSSIE